MNSVPLISALIDLLGPLALVLVLIGLYNAAVGSSSSSNQSPDHEAYVRDNTHDINGYEQLPKHEQEFLKKYGVKLSKAGYYLESDLRTLKITRSDNTVAAFTITESNSLDIFAFDNGQLVTIEPVEGHYDQSELRRKEIRLNRILTQESQ